MIKMDSEAHFKGILLISLMVGLAIVNMLGFPWNFLVSIVLVVIAFSKARTLSESGNASMYSEAGT